MTDTSSISGTSHTYQSIIAMFETRDAAEQARQRLIDRNIPSTDIVIQAADPDATESVQQDRQPHERSFWDWLLGEDVPEEHRTAYRAGIRSGHTLLSVRAIDSAREYDEIATILEHGGAINVNEGDHYGSALGSYHRDWDDDRDSARGDLGHSTIGTETGAGLGTGLTGSGAGLTGAGLAGTGVTDTPHTSSTVETDREALLDEPNTSVSPASAAYESGTTPATGYIPPETTDTGTGTSGLGTTGTGTTATPATEEAVIPVAKEELRVGVRQSRNVKAYRIRSTVTEVPVEQNVRLRDETVTVEHRPSTGVTNTGDAFREQTVEVHETHEEPMVEKVVTQPEEVVIHKSGTERTETVHDTVRETHVDVDDGSTTGTGTGTTTSDTERVAVEPLDPSATKP